MVIIMAAIKKISMIISHSDVVNLISELIYLECFEPMEPEIAFNLSELDNYIERETMDLEPYEVNIESLTLLTTKYTYTLIGWMPAEFESELTSALSGLTCAWEIEDPEPDEAEYAPVYIKHPHLFGKLRSAGRSVFEPLAKKQIVF
ncbi:MAG: hypothetical protein FWD05_04770 [Oscillospiraceae bacterium]|nr:hypothetical protein [Oscillospiraceae bacterium]